MRVNSCRCAELFAGFQRWLRLKLKTDRQNRGGERERERGRAKKLFQVLITLGAAETTLSVKQLTIERAHPMNHRLSSIQTHCRSHNIIRETYRPADVENIERVWSGVEKEKKKKKRNVWQMHSVRSPFVCK